MQSKMKVFLPWHPQHFRLNSTEREPFFKTSSIIHPKSRTCCITGAISSPALDKSFTRSSAKTPIIHNFHTPSAHFTSVDQHFKQLLSMQRNHAIHAAVLFCGWQVKQKLHTRLFLTEIQHHFWVTHWGNKDQHVHNLLSVHWRAQVDFTTVITDCYGHKKSAHLTTVERCAPTN